MNEQFKGPGQGGQRRTRKSAHLHPQTQTTEQSQGKWSWPLCRADHDTDQHLRGGSASSITHSGKCPAMPGLLLTSALASRGDVAASHQPVGHTAPNPVPGMGGCGGTLRAGRVWGHSGSSCCQLGILCFTKICLNNAAHTCKDPMPSGFGWGAREEGWDSIPFSKTFSPRTLINKSDFAKFLQENEKQRCWSKFYITGSIIYWTS